jgi:hypothetical protein
MCEISFDLEWTIIRHLSWNRGSWKNTSMHLNPVVHFNASQLGYTPVVKQRMVLHISKVEK